MRNEDVKGGGGGGGGDNNIVTGDKWRECQQHRLYLLL